MGFCILREVQGYRPRILAVATAAVREAANRAVLLNGLRQRVGVEVEVLSGEKEARLGAMAVLWSVSRPEGSLIWGWKFANNPGAGGEMVVVASFPFGAVRLTQRFLKHDPPAAWELAALPRGGA